MTYKKFTFNKWNLKRIPLWRFLSVNKKNSIEWSEAKHIIISYINDYYSKDDVIRDENFKINWKLKWTWKENS